MDSISAVALSLALGAGAIAGKEVVSASTKDAYATLKNLIQNRYSKVQIEQIELAPESKKQRAVLGKDLAAGGAARDTELAAAAMELIELVRHQSPVAVAAIGVDFRDVAAASLRLADIAASGTGVKLERSIFSGDIDIRGVRAGVPPDGSLKGS